MLIQCVPRDKQKSKCRQRRRWQVVFKERYLDIFREVYQTGQDKPETDTLTL